MLLVAIFVAAIQVNRIFPVDDVMHLVRGRTVLPKIDTLKENPSAAKAMIVPTAQPREMGEFCGHEPDTFPKHAVARNHEVGDKVHRVHQYEGLSKKNFETDPKPDGKAVEPLYKRMWTSATRPGARTTPLVGA